MNICVFGDSISWGAYDPENGGWCNILRNYLEKLDRDISVYNLGICGDTSETLLSRLENEAKSRVSDLIIISIGTNDYSLVAPENQNWVDREKFKNNLEEIVKVSKKICDKLLFVGITPVDESKTQPLPQSPDYSYLKKERDEYDLILSKFCQSNSFEYVDLNNKLDFFDLADGLHPTTIGHKKIFQEVMVVVEEFILPEQDPRQS